MSEHHYSTPKQTNGMAIASMVTGILSIVSPYLGIILGIVAIVLGTLAKRAIDENGGEGRNLAVTGFICGIVGLCLWILMGILVVIGFIAFFSVTHDATTTF